MKDKLHFDAPPIDLGAVTKTPDGGIILNAKPMRSGDYEYYGFELGDAGQRGFAWDARLTGRVEPSEVSAILSQFLGLPITDDHYWITFGESDGVVGTVISDASLDDSGLVNTKAKIAKSETAMRVLTGKAQELSIGFVSQIEWVANRNEGDPHFYIREIELNHVAVVEQGRAGAEARLANHRTQLETPNMKSILINGAPVQVEDQVAQEFERLSNAVTAATTERDTARGENAALQSQLANSKTNADVAAEAAKLAGRHAAFADEAVRMGHSEPLVLGAYDEAALKRAILANAKIAVAADASTDFLNGAWAIALQNSAPGRSVLDVQTVTTEATDDYSAHIKLVNSSYLPQVKKGA